MDGIWTYALGETRRYGTSDDPYRRAMEFLAPVKGTIADWGCGAAYAKRFCPPGRYFGIDGAPGKADLVTDLLGYREPSGGILLRHVLEHNFPWRVILNNALGAFQERMVLGIFTPWQEVTRVLAMTSTGAPDIGFRKRDLTACFAHLPYTEEIFLGHTQYGSETLFLIERPKP